MSNSGQGMSCRAKERGGWVISQSGKVAGRELNSNSGDLNSVCSNIKWNILALLMGMNAMNAINVFVKHFE